MSEKEACGNSCIFGREKTCPGTIFCDFGVHFEVQFRMFFEEKLVFGVAYFFFDFDVFFGRGRRQGVGPSRPQILQFKRG
jgi:hypothetical protein